MTSRALSKLWARAETRANSKLNRLWRRLKSYARIWSGSRRAKGNADSKVSSRAKANRPDSKGNRANKAKVSRLVNKDSRAKVRVKASRVGSSKDKVVN